jgi:hypothetical protein
VTRLHLAKPLLISVWALSLIVPHFQSDPGALELILDAALVSLTGYALFQVISLDTERSLLRFTPLIVSPFMLSLVVLVSQFLGFSAPYLAWTRTGAGPMTYQGEIFPLGDLVQLTSGASCWKEIEVGSDICDPWGRALNQNPHVVEFFRFFNMTNVYLVGTLAVLLLALATLLFKSRCNGPNIAILLFVMSPPISLALDRGNETLTISLILLGLYLLMSPKRLLQSIGISLLALAAVFKLWPTLLVILVAWVFRSRLSKIQVLLALSGLLYWILNFQTALRMLESTQHGSQWGNSFGLKLWIREDFSITNVLLLCAPSLILSFFIIRFLSSWPVRSVSESEKFELQLIAILSIIYGLIWLVGESFSYRLSILLPLIILLSKSSVWKMRWSKTLVVLILTTMISARLATTTALTTSLAICAFYFGWNLLYRLKSDYI